MQSHLERRCPEREVECTYCKQTMTANALGKQPVQPFGMISCASDDCYKSAWTGHLAECAHATVRCEFWSIGCRDLIKRSEMPAHHAADASAHASLTVQKFASMQQEMERLVQKHRDDTQWEQMGMSWRVATPSLTAGTTRKVIQSTGVLTAGNKMCALRTMMVALVFLTIIVIVEFSACSDVARRRYLRLDVAEGDEGELKVNLCTERPPWSPVRVREVSICIEDRPDTWSDGPVYRGQPLFYTRVANLQAPGHSCGGHLSYTCEPDSDHDSESDDDQVRHPSMICCSELHNERPPSNYVIVVFVTGRLILSVSLLRCKVFSIEMMLLRSRPDISPVPISTTSPLRVS